ncbi:MAG: ABC transporter substrate-binding protein [bacterium]|nr:ABC transporter substrate-binding protein [bacterium]MDE0668587.1 ABC transporter substrate-binding protein [bacterium]MXZ30378.1 ABC transporter substrate-binding protein [Acidimicrobiia bacterium]MYB25655.1 ABC transporter substrate-binding protein [Acidimicrobiia bacterium]
MTRTTYWTRLLAIGVVLSLLLAACASEDTAETDAARAEAAAAQAAAQAAEAAAAAAEAEAEQARAEAELAAAQAAEDEAAVAAAQAALAEAEAQAQAAAEAAETAAAAAEAEAAEAMAEAELAAARAAEDEAAVEAAEAALAEAQSAAAEAQEAADAAQAQVQAAQAEAAAALAEAEAAAAAAGIDLNDVIISTPSLVAQADYARAPYVAPAHAAGLLALGGYLYRYEADGTVVPDLATDFPDTSDDGLTMTVTLREGLVYSDGTPVVAQDAVVTLRRAKEEGPFAGNLGAFDYAEATDDRTIVYHMNSPLSCRLSPVVCAEHLPLHPHEQVEADAEAYFAQPVSASQYVIADWQPGSPTMVLEANPNYWRGEPVIKKLTLASATDPISRLLQVTTGAAAMGFDIPVAVRADLPEDVNQIVHPIGGVFWFVIRSDSPGPLSDVRVRRALCLAMDRDAINERAFLGIAEPISSILSQYRTEWDHVNILPMERDVETARALLAEAGYPDGFSTPLQTMGARPGWTDAATILAENWADIGVTAEVQPLEDAIIIENIRNRNYDTMWIGSGGDNLTILRFLWYPENFWSSSIAFADDQVTAAYDELVDAFARGDQEASQRLQVEIQERAFDVGANYCPQGERAVLVGSRLSTDILAMIPASQNFWVATEGG